jgi:hypothetical protein
MARAHCQFDSYDLFLDILQSMQIFARITKQIELKTIRKKILTFLR